MIIFADYNLAMALKLTGKCTLMNFISPLAIGLPVRNIIPHNNITQLFYNSTDNAPCNNEEKIYYRELFRSSYLQFLCEYDPFMGIMEIMTLDYLNPDNVVILSDLNNELVSNLVECICQFIYDRWYYKTAIVYDIEDYMTINQSEIDPRFIGVFNADKEYYLTHIDKNEDD